MDRQVDISLLGSITIRVDGRRVPAGPPLQQALLAILAIEVGTTVPVSDLIDRLWGDDPPRTAPKSVQKYVSQLRRSLGPDAIARDGDAYRLDLPPASIDVRRMEVDLAAATAEADPQRRLDALTAALDRHPPSVLPGLAREVAVAERTRIAELRLAAAEARLQTALDLGRLALVVADASSLAEAHPFREHPWRLLMLALYRSGRQADALRAYQRLRSRLARDLGLEPSIELRDLEAGILAHDPRLLATVPPGPDPVGGGPSDPPPWEERRQVSLVLAGPGHGTDLLAELAARHGGTPGTTPHGPVVVIGIPAGDEDAAVAARAALELFRAGRGPVGLTSGVFLVQQGHGRAGHPFHIDDDAVTRAHRRVGHAIGPGPVIDPTTLHLLGDRAVTELSSDLEPVLVDVLAPSGRRAAAPFTGRAAELDRLTGAWRACLDAGGGQLFVIGGEGGVGKSRLLAEAELLLRPDQTAWFSLVCRRREGPFSPVARLFGSLFGPDPVAVITGRLGRTDLPARESAWLRTHLSLLFDGDAEGRVDEPERLRAWAQLLGLALAPAGTVLAIDDGHLAPPLLHGLVDELLALAETPLLVIAAGRADAAPPGPWPITGDRPTTSLPLRRLDHRSSDRLARSLLVDEHRSLVEAVARRSGGNPYFLHELARTVAETGRLDDAPSTVRQAVAARIDRLGDEARLVLQTAAIVDAPVSAEVLGALTGLATTAVATALTALRNRQLMAPAEAAPSGHRLDHPLAAEVAASQVTPSRALVIHRAMVERLRAAGEQTIEALERLDDHATRAEQLAEAADHPDLAVLRVRAGEAALGLGQRLELADPGRANDALLRATERLTPGSGDWVQACLGAGRTAIDLADWGLADRLLGRAIASANRLGDRRSESLARVALDGLRWRRGDERPNEDLDRAIELVSDEPGPELATALAWHAAKLANIGRPELALALADRYREVVEANGTVATRFSLANTTICCRLGEGDQSAFRDLRQIIDDALARGLTRNALTGLNNLAHYTWLHRGAREAEPIAQETIDTATSRGHASTAQFAAGTLASIRYDAGQWDHVLAVGRVALDGDDRSPPGLELAVRAAMVELWRAAPRDRSDLLESRCRDALAFGELQLSVPWLATVALDGARHGDRARVLDAADELSRLTTERVDWRCAELDLVVRALVVVGANDEARRLLPAEPVPIRRHELARQTAGAVLDLADGGAERAIEGFEAALAGWTDAGHPLAEAQAASGLAAARSLAGDRVGASAARQRAVEGHRALGIPTEGRWWDPSPRPSPSIDRATSGFATAPRSSR